MRSRVEITLHHGFLVAASLVMLFPLAWMILTSLKTYPEAIADPPVMFPATPQWGNYAEALTGFSFGRYFVNSVMMAVLTVVGTVLSCSMAAYGFARLYFPRKAVIFLLLLTALMLPPQILIIPQFWIYVQLNWINTLYPLFVPAFLGINVFAIFLLRQFFLQIPQDYIDAARIDGAGEFRILFGVFLPLTKPAVVTVILFTFIGSWNDLWTPLIFIHDEALYTLPLGLISFLASIGQAEGTLWHLMMAAATLTVIPIIALFAFLQRYFIEGISLTGVKG